jgi:hypothetical protein
MEAVREVTLLFASTVMVVVQVLLLLELGGQVLPFHWTLVCGTKPVPFIVIVNPALPAGTLAGERKFNRAPVLF